ncbi:MAG: hypothetical protein ACK55I_27230, partial [bacterium]
MPDSGLAWAGLGWAQGSSMIMIVLCLVVRERRREEAYKLTLTCVNTTTHGSLMMMSRCRHGGRGSYVKSVYGTR